MRFATSLITVLVSLCSLQAVSADNSHAGEPPARYHRHRRPTVVVTDERRDLIMAPRHQLQKRYSNARFTFYKTGLGACGGHNNDNDFIVALNHGQFDSGNWCGKSVTITVGGKSTQAVVVDRCAGCPFGALDFSPGLFRFFASESAGEIFGSWVEGVPPPPEPSKPPPPKTTSSPKPTPTTTSTSSTRTTTMTSSARTSSTSTSSSSSTTQTSATPSSTPGPAQTGNLFELNAVVLNLAGLVASAAKGRGNSTNN